MWVTLVLVIALGIHGTIVYAQNSLSEDNKQELLDIHNLFRGIVTPPASNMLRMVSTPVGHMV